MEYGTPSPLKYAEIIRSRLEFSTEPPLNDIELADAKKKLEALKISGEFEAIEYIALGRVLYNLKKFHDFENVMREGFIKIQDPNILLDLLVGKMHQIDSGLSDESYDRLIDEWFEVNKSKINKDFVFKKIGNSFHVFHFYAKLKKRLVCDIAIRPDYSVLLLFGEFAILSSFDYLSFIKFDVFSVLVDEIVRMYQNNEITHEIEIFLKEYLEEESLLKLKELSKVTNLETNSFKESDFVIA